MNTITYIARIPPTGNPDGIIDAPSGALFFKDGPFYKVNYSGSIASGWAIAEFKAYTTPDYYLGADDVQLLTVDSGTALYTKTSISGTPYGWALLSNESPFIHNS